MATVTKPTTTRKYTTAESQQKVRHPLDQLRGVIRCYVAAEGLAVLALFLALWFWLGLLLDYGAFQLLGIDWVQVAPWSMRAFFLGVIVTALVAVVAVKVVWRLAREFRDSALALVLERRFPQLLGDRLITAVELADTQMADRYGYSKDMIENTIRDAAERVDTLSIKEVFNWKRLAIYWVAVAALTVGVYVLVALSYCAVKQSWAVSRFYHRFNDVAAIWTERNLLLMDTLWPRSAHLELLYFPANGERRVGRDVGSTSLRVRALKWVVADPQVSEGWRALQWDEVGNYVGVAPPPVPEVWTMNRPPSEWTADQVELSLNQLETREQLDGSTRAALGQVFEQLQAAADDPRMSRVLRQLTIPETVMVYHEGEKRAGEKLTLQPEGAYEFSGVLTELTESIRFYAYGEDYATPYYQVILVPPPSIERLTCDRREPAYLHYQTPRDGEPADLKGLKQTFRNQPVSLNGDSSRIDIPAGADVTIHGVADKPLRSVRLLSRERRARPGTQPASAMTSLPPAAQLDAAGRAFTVAISNVTGVNEFDFELTDADNVIGRRHMILWAVEDLDPDVHVEIMVLRRNNQGYLVTPSAMIPLKGKIRDDHGLDAVDYAYSYSETDAPATLNLQAALLAGGAMQFLPLVPSGSFVVAPFYLNAAGRAFRDDATALDKKPLLTFSQRAAEQRAFAVTKSQLEQHLQTKLPKQVLIRELELNPNIEFDSSNQVNPGVEYFDLQRHLPQLKASDDFKQPFYRLRLTVQATDNNVENEKGPVSRPNKETFTILVVPERDLLAAIAQEQDTLHVKLKHDALDRLRDGALEKLTTEFSYLAELERTNDVTPASLGPRLARASEIEDLIFRAQDVTRAVHEDYLRILKELQVNRVSDSTIKDARNIVEPLRDILNAKFPAAVEANKAYRKELEAHRLPNEEINRNARQSLEDLILSLEQVLQNMDTITSLNEVIARLRAIREAQEDQSQRFAQIQKRIEDELLKALGGLE